MRQLYSPPNSDYFPKGDQRDLHSAKEATNHQPKKRSAGQKGYSIPPPDKIQSWCRYLASRHSSKEHSCRDLSQQKLSRQPYMSTEPTEENRRSPTIESLDSVKRSKGSKKGLSLTKKLHVKASQQQTTVKLAVQNSSKTMIDPTRNQHRIAFKLEDFQKMGLLGSGGFGKVYLVRHLNSGTLFAMKIVKPSILQDQKLAKYLFEEKRVQQSCNHPFLVKLVEVIDTCHTLFEYFPGGDLLTHIRHYGRFSEDQIRVMLSEIILAMEYLHFKDIIYRDLKVNDLFIQPENVVLDKQGHLHLTDFGLCKQIRGKTFTFCGSMGYIAPEIMRNEGHTKTVDWYHLGVLAYQLLTGQLPGQPNPASQTMTISLPRCISAELKSLIKGLLHLDPLQRIGSRFDSQEVRSHPFFRSVDWKAVLNKQCSIPSPSKCHQMMVQ